MTKTIIRRLLILVPQLIVLSLALFLLAEAMPGDAIMGLAGNYANPEEVEALRAMHGLGGPWYELYFRWITNALRGDFGRSLVHNASVMSLIQARIPNTLFLSLLSTVLTLIIAFPLGIIAARYARKWQDQAILSYCFITQAIPLIALAILAIWIFALRLGWFPRGGSQNVLIPADDTVAIVLSRLQHLLLPSLVLAVLGNLSTVFILRAQIVENSSSAYVTTAKSKGVPSRVIYSKHIMRNSLLPFAQGIPFLVIGLLMGSVMIERIFSFPGMGDLFIGSLQARDFTVVNALTMLYGALTVIGILAGDILLTALDPRIKVK
jgi:peptide/nickel transport system permease protein